MQNNDTERVTQKPSKPQVVNGRFMYVFVFLTARNDSDDGRTAECHKCTHCGMQPQGAHKQINDKTQAKSCQQQRYFRHIDRKQHYENHINIGVYVAS